MTPTASGYAQPEGLKLLETAAQTFGPLFTLEQIRPLANEQGLSQTHLRKLISGLAESGRICILKRGTYAVTHSPLLAEEIHPFAIALALAQPAAISHWSALAQHGFTTQMPAMIQASTPRKVITPEMRSGQAHSPRNRAVWRALDLEIEFIYVQSAQFFGHQTLWVNRWQKVLVTDPERTALDLLARPDIFGGLRAAIEIFETTLAQISVPKLVDYTLQYKVGSVIKRTGWLLEQLGIPAEQTTALQAYPVTNYYRLDPKNQASAAAYNARWHIIENLKMAPHA
jgi:predicted transcriptional regulator of viral defense system